jgi:hypothetical protein
MITHITRSATPLDDAIYALAQIGPDLDATSLDSLVRRYAEHAGTLTELAIELVLDALEEGQGEVVEPQTPDMIAAVSQAMSHFHNQLYVVEAKARAAQAQTLARPQNPFASWGRDELRAFGVRLGANTVFAMKVRDCQIEADTMTLGFKKHVAEAAMAPLELIVAHFAGDSRVAAQTRFKSDQKPEVGKKQTFDEALRTSRLTEQQQAFLKSL